VELEGSAGSGRRPGRLIAAAHACGPGRMLTLKTHIDNQISLELVSDRNALRIYGVEPRLFAHDFAVYSDVYIPVTDSAAADRKLAPVFETARESLSRAGARLYDKYKP
jgi:hypothetical protein